MISHDHPKNRIPHFQYSHLAFNIENIKLTTTTINESITNSEVYLYIC